MVAAGLMINRHIGQQLVQSAQRPAACKAPRSLIASHPAPPALRVLALQVAMQLLESGADPQRLDFSGRNALDLAVLHGHLELVEPLLDGGCWFTGGSGEAHVGDRAYRAWFRGAAAELACWIGSLEVALAGAQALTPGRQLCDIQLTCKHLTASVWLTCRQ